jgi:hypothetical protein
VAWNSPARPRQAVQTGSPWALEFLVARKTEKSRKVLLPLLKYVKIMMAFPAKKLTGIIILVFKNFFPQLKSHLSICNSISTQINRKMAGKTFSEGFCLAWSFSMRPELNSSWSFSCR